MAGIENEQERYNRKTYRGIRGITNTIYKSRGITYKQIDKGKHL